MRLAFWIVALVASPVVVAYPALAYDFTCRTETGTGICVGEFEQGTSDPWCSAPGSRRQAQTGVGLDLGGERVASVDGYDSCFEASGTSARRDAIAVYGFFATVRYMHDECRGPSCGPQSNACRVEVTSVDQRGLFVPCATPDFAWGRLLP